MAGPDDIYVLAQQNPGGLQLNLARGDFDFPFPGLIPPPPEDGETVLSRCSKVGEDQLNDSLPEKPRGKVWAVSRTL